MAERSGFWQFLRRSIPGTIWAIGVSSLLMNLATSVVFSGSALYLKTILGVATSTIGFIEAIVEAVAYAIRIFSGVISDYFKRRKALMVIGFIMLTISKPLLAFSRTFIGVFFARTIDRIGNGIQASPREALISDSAPKQVKGACFGLRQSLAVIGSTLGGIFGIVVMKLTNDDFQLLFLFAAIPAALATVVLTIFVKEKLDESKSVAKRRKIKLKDLHLLGKKFWLFMVVAAVFMLGRFSEIFISLHACGNFGLDVAYGTVITMIYNLLSTLVAFPVGRLSDRMNRTNLLLVGFLILLFAHISIGCANNLNWVLFGTVLWGAQRGITEGILSVVVSDYVPKELRGTGFGIYYLVVSVSTAVASAVAGVISQQSGEGAAFLFGGVVCLFALLLLFAVRRFLSKKD
ncbi:MAG: MFS transporter [Alphaproteobacteria bacterium]|nr:MFS transporter [Alphaproteobacteria bacterium]